jgi:hypothetical protein
MTNGCQPQRDTRIRGRLYDIAASLYWASESGANVDLRELCGAYDSSAPEPVTPEERRLLRAMITLIPLHWVATAGFMDEPTGVHGTVGVAQADRAMDAAEAWWARREELTWSTAAGGTSPHMAPHRQGRLISSLPPVARRRTLMPCGAHNPAPADLRVRDDSSPSQSWMRCRPGSSRSVALFRSCRGGAL